MDKQDQQMNISKKILEAIETRKVKPKPRWYFAIQEGSIWTLGLVTTFCGAVAISTTLFVFATAPFRFHPATHESPIRFWIEFMPMLWVVLFVSFVFATDYFLRKTKKGYKYGFVVLTISSVTLSVVLGYVGFLIGLGEFIDRGLGSRIPFHTPTQVMIQKMWSQPSKGLLTGTIVENETALLTHDGSVFDIEIEHLPELQKNFIEDGMRVSLIGTTTPQNTFFVCIVVPIHNKDFLIDPMYLERKIEDERTNTCKGVRPYDRLKTKILNYEN